MQLHDKECIDGQAEFNDLTDIKKELMVWVSHQDGDCEECVRLLDFAKVRDVGWSKQLILQVRRCKTGEWVTYRPKVNSMRGLLPWYSLIRNVLGWKGPVHIGVASGGPPTP
jgi:hypothetical protein